MVSVVLCKMSFLLGAATARTQTSVGDDGVQRTLTYLLAFATVRNSIGLVSEQRVDPEVCLSERSRDAQARECCLTPTKENGSCSRNRQTDRFKIFKILSPDAFS